MPICLSLAGTTTYVSDRQAEEVLIGTVSGVFSIKKDQARKWKVAGQSLAGRHIHALTVEPSTGLMFAGVHNGGVYASTDFGKTWDIRDQGLTEKNIYSLAMARVNGDLKLYAGSEPARLFESEDVGKTWHELPSLRNVPSVGNWTFPAPPHQAHVKNIAIDPRQPSTLYACVEQGGLFRSRDAGESWDELHGYDEDLPFQIPQGTAIDDLHRVLIRPSDPKWLYICGGFGLCSSRDGGKTWEHLTTPNMRIGYPDPLLIHPYREDLMFMAGAINNPFFWRESHDADATIARSKDGGKTWEILHQGLPPHMRAHVNAMSIEAVNGSFQLFAGTTDGDIYYSDTEGDSWTKIVDGVPPLSKAGHYIMLGAAEKAKAQ
jgi:photosystem II stability/assembly factor-like uncharacterized protein